MSTITDEERRTASDVFYLPAGGINESEMSDEEIDWGKFVDEMADGIEYAKLVIYREPTDRRGNVRGKSMAYLFECGISDYTFSQLMGYIRDEYGSGIYRIQARDKSGALKKNKRVQVEAPKSTSVTTTDQNAPGSVIEQMALAMDRQQERFEIMLERMQHNNSPANGFDQITQLMGVMGALMKNMGIQPMPPAPPKTMIEQLTEFKMLRELMSDIGGGDDSGRVDNFWSAISEVTKNFGGPLMQALAMAQQNGDLNNDGTIKNRLDAPKPNPQPTTGPKNEMEAMRPQLQFLLTQAEAEKEPAEVADYILDLIDNNPEALQSLETFLQAENVIDQIAAVEPGVNKHRGWFAQWRAVMLKELAEIFSESDDDLTNDGQPDNDAPNPTANQTGAADNESAGPIDDATAKRGDGALAIDGDT